MRYLLMNYLIKALFSMEVSKQNQTNTFLYQTYMIFALEKHLSLIEFNSGYFSISTTTCRIRQLPATLCQR